MLDLKVKINKLKNNNKDIKNKEYVKKFITKFFTKVCIFQILKM